MRHPRYSPQFHYVLLAALFFEFVELELFNLGPLHHIVDAILILVFAFSGAILSESRKHGAAILILGAVPWMIDAAGFTPSFFDLESAFWMVLHIYLARVILGSLGDIGSISHTEIIDAVSLYVVIGLTFANLYGVLLFLDPGAIAADGGTVAMTYDLILYYSFITQATVGYGDVTPASPVIRVVSVIQAVFGVMYVAVLIARFVAIYAANEVHSSRADDESGP
ncbi:MAG: two pore domain potassium channel family protein [Aridibacter famidurans]|nr:two pore domain potassium channel family protein [Aridibacter famidurans]